MKNTKTKIILSAIIFLSVAGFAGIVFAAGPFLYVSPASLTKTVGSTFGASIGVNASGSKVCAVEGTLVFNNLSCQSITLASDATPQSSPTCSNPHFLIGVPSCTTADKVLFTVSVKAGNAGTASISFTGVDIIGEGVSISSSSIGGSYTLISPISPTCSCTAWSSWQSGICGGGDCPSTQRLQTRTRTCTPAGCNIENESRCIEDSSCVPVGEEVVPPKEEVIPPKEEVVPPEKKIVTIPPEERVLGEGLAPLLLASLGVIRESAWMMILTTFCFVGLIVIGIREWELARKKKKNIS